MPRSRQTNGHAGVGAGALSLLLLPALLWTVVMPSSAAHAGGQGFTFDSRAVVERGSLGAWTSAFIDPGATLFHDGRFHMMYAAVPTWPHPLAIGYSSSEDGVTWKKESPEPILTGADTGLGYESIASNSVVVTDEGQWVLYFSLVYPGNAFVGAIARATAPAPLGPWTTDRAPVLLPGPDGAWDGKYVGNASVVKSAEGYRMYYTEPAPLPSAPSRRTMRT